MRRGIAAFGIGLAACSGDAAPRAQTLLEIDTDAPVVGQLADDPELSVDAAIDTLRVDVLGEAGAVTETRTIVAADARDWPVSLGIAGGVTLRLRAYRAVLAGATEPATPTAIDRVVRVSPPAAGVAIVRVVLRAECMGTPASFLAPVGSCVDRANVREPNAAGQAHRTQAAPHETLVGSWSGAREIPCARAPSDPSSDPRVCIPGGFLVLGDERLAGLREGMDPLPTHPVLVSPFLLDRTEVTVGQVRRLAAERALAANELPDRRGSGNDLSRFCTWLGPSDAANDAFPVNCVSYRTASKVCGLLGGRLPTEAEWEHAARGRGQRRSYPWGEGEPDCCMASISRPSEPLVPVFCSGEGVERAGSHARSSACAGDVSRDGALDLGGSLAEMTLDKAAPYTHPCWGSGLRRDPRCEDETTNDHSLRGGTWWGGPLTAQSALRARTVGTLERSAGNGFRCRYDAGAP